MLVLEGVHTFYGESHILQGVSLRVQAGEVVCLLGRNGVGKTTTLRTILGLTPPREGSVVFKGQSLQGRPAYRIARMGIGFVDENRRIFSGLTVEENLLVARKPMAEEKRAWPMERIYETFPQLAETRSRYGDYLSGGQQQMLAIARALAGEPQLLLLDEPNEGLAPVIVNQVGELITQLAESTTIIFTDQNLKFAMKYAHRGYVLEKGQIVYESPREKFKDDVKAIEQRLMI